MTIAVGGFSLCGIPEQLIIALRDTGVKDRPSSPTTPESMIGASVCCCRPGRSPNGRFICRKIPDRAAVHVRRTGTRVHPPGPLAERLRAGGAGIPGFYTKTGVGTVVAEGKETKEFDGELYVLERGIRADLALVKAHTGDEMGNLVYRMTARNFNPMVAMCGKITVAEVEHLVPSGTLDPDQIHTASIFVNHIVQTTSEKRIEQRTVQTP